MLSAMLANESCHIYFLVDADKTVFSLHANADWGIVDLKTAIIREAGLNLRASDVILRKVRMIF